MLPQAVDRQAGLDALDGPCEIMSVKTPAGALYVIRIDTSVEVYAANGARVRTGTMTAAGDVRWADLEQRAASTSQSESRMEPTLRSAAGFTPQPTGHDHSPLAVRLRTTSPRSADRESAAISAALRSDRESAGISAALRSDRESAGIAGGLSRSRRMPYD
jgi:hypothetical protein